MDKELQEALFGRYPEIFSERNFSAEETAMNRGITAGNGWFQLLDGLCFQLQQATSERGAPQVVASRVKEKLGSLRFRVRGADDRQSGMIAVAEEMSTRICEECGAPAMMAADGWARTLCSRHATPVPPGNLPRIKLTRADIDATLPTIAECLDQYLWIQARATHGSRPLSDDFEFQKKFNDFYGSRRCKRGWKATFFQIMEEGRHHNLAFDAVLIRLLLANRRHDPSFASKLVATFDSSSPIIDSKVLENLAMSEPHTKDVDRKTAAWIDKHNHLRDLYEEFLESAYGTYLNARFASMYPRAEVSDVKKLDFVLWKYKGPALI